MGTTLGLTETQSGVWSRRCEAGDYGKAAVMMVTGEGDALRVRRNGGASFRLGSGVGFWGKSNVSGTFKTDRKARWGFSNVLNLFLVACWDG